MQGLLPGIFVHHVLGVGVSRGNAHTNPSLAGIAFDMTGRQCSACASAPGIHPPDENRKRGGRIDRASGITRRAPLRVERLRTRFPLCPRPCGPEAYLTLTVGPGEVCMYGFGLLSIRRRRNQSPFDYRGNSIPRQAFQQGVS